ncbi:hypothetical protein [Massilia sp. PWRC2]|uniref:hypothetical protein n=1 Tax=Massilia sp. PWRC2 TaxID=2804626 RepID=UPI003CF164E5
MTTDSGIVTTDSGIVTSDSGIVTTDSGIVTSDSGIVTTDSGIVTSDSGIVTTDSGRCPKSVTFVRNGRSRSNGMTGHDAGMTGHVRPEYPVHDGRIHPQPKKIGRQWWVAPYAEYVGD